MASKGFGGGGPEARPEVGDFYSTLLGGTSFWHPHAIGEPPCNASSLQVWRPPGRGAKASGEGMLLA
jgi:hypothetical protein